MWNVSRCNGLYNLLGVAVSSWRGCHQLDRSAMPIIGTFFLIHPSFFWTPLNVLNFSFKNCDLPLIPKNHGYGRLGLVTVKTWEGQKLVLMFYQLFATLVILGVTSIIHGKFVNLQVKKRWSKAHRVCKKIAISKAPKGFRRRLAKGAGISASNFGLNLQAVPKTQWKTLRTAISRALGCCGAGASPWLAVATYCLDPQLGNLTTVCRFWRRFIKSFPTQYEPFICNLLHVGTSKIGPVANFLKTLNAAGWFFVDPETMVHTSSKTKVLWRSCSNKHLAYVFQKCWPWTITEKSPTRKDWDRTVFDIPHVWQSRSNTWSSAKCLNTRICPLGNTLQMMSSISMIKLLIRCVPFALVLIVNIIVCFIALHLKKSGKTYESHSVGR